MTSRDLSPDLGHEFDSSTEEDEAPVVSAAQWNEMQRNMKMLTAKLLNMEKKSSESGEENGASSSASGSVNVILNPKMSQIDKKKDIKE